MDVIGFGPLELKKIIYVDKLPNKGGFSLLKNKETFAGGSAANTIAALAKLQVPTGFIGKIGSDPEGSMIIEDMINHGVDARGIKLCDGRSGIVIEIVDETGERMQLADPGANDEIETKDVPIKYIEKAKFLHISPFQCRNSKKSFETQQKLVREARRMGLSISMDPGLFYAKMGAKELENFIRDLYLLLLDEDEIRMLTGKNYREGSMYLAKAGVDIVAVKLGSEGSFVRCGTEEIHVPPFRVNAVDFAGCGDAFNAGFIFGLLNKKKPEQCAILGNGEAALCARSSGTRSGLPTKDELLRFCNGRL